MTAKELKTIMKKGGIDTYEDLLFKACMCYNRQAREDEEEYPMIAKIEKRYYLAIREELEKRGFFDN